MPHSTAMFNSQGVGAGHDDIVRALGRIGEDAAMAQAGRFDGSAAHVPRRVINMNIMIESSTCNSFNIALTYDL